MAVKIRVGELADVGKGGVSDGGRRSHGGACRKILCGYGTGKSDNAECHKNETAVYYVRCVPILDSNVHYHFNDNWHKKVEAGFKQLKKRSHKALKLIFFQVF